VYLKPVGELHGHEGHEALGAGTLGVPKTTVLGTSRSGAARTAMVARRSGPAEISAPILTSEKAKGQRRRESSAFLAVYTWLSFKTPFPLHALSVRRRNPPPCSTRTGPTGIRRADWSRRSAVVSLRVNSQKGINSYGTNSPRCTNNAPPPRRRRPRPNAGNRGSCKPA
jgi:hypothetical protein